MQVAARRPIDSMVQFHNPRHSHLKVVKHAHLSIPAKLHFCWIGAKLPWAYIFALLSAAENSGLPVICLHHTELLQDGEELRALQSDPRLRLCHVDAEDILLKTGEILGVGGSLHALYARLQSSVARADVLRAAILYGEGGIYLDLDTVTIASLQPLLAANQFVGTEHIVWPQAARISRSPSVLARHIALDILRKILKASPHGWKRFRRVQGLYPLGVNNAIMGCVAGSGFMAEYLRAMLDLPSQRQAQRYALGPQLLQDVIRYHQADDVTIHPPETFYPLPPEISEHWFRRLRAPKPDQVISATTCVVHWYASVRTRGLVAEMSPSYVLQNRGNQLYSALVWTHIPALRRLAGGDQAAGLP